MKPLVKKKKIFSKVYIYVPSNKIIRLTSLSYWSCSLVGWVQPVKWTPREQKGMYRRRSSRRAVASVCCWYLAPSFGRITEPQLEKWKGREGGSPVKYLIGKLWIFHVGDVSDSGHMSCCPPHPKQCLFFLPLNGLFRDSRSLLSSACTSHTKLWTRRSELKSI